MIKEVQIKVWPDKIEDKKYIAEQMARQSKLKPDGIKHVEIIRRSIDARQKRPFYLVRGQVYFQENFVKRQPHKFELKPGGGKTAVIIGAGPAGYFCALEMIALGIKPIILERGKDVQLRRRDLRAIQQEGLVNPHSNYCFGEGGAGTYSDGKLYTRSHKRGNIQRVLEILVDHGAPSDILIDAHPHIGSNKLPQVVANLRNTIVSGGGEIHFDSYVVDFATSSNKIVSALTSTGKEFKGDSFVLATGHSARDIYELMHRKKWLIEPKSFALGLRIEHSQGFIDQMQYNQRVREDNLPAASYKAVCQINGSGVFSFCMCPGGLVVPAATAPGEIVVNGMSLSRRDSPFANSGLVTSIETEELVAMGYTGVFGNMNFQKEVEQTMFEAGDGSQKAPAQRVKDFVDGKMSSSLNDTSYIPGLFSAPLHELLPSFVAKRLREGIVAINKKMRGYMTQEANIIGVESRTSSPIRIPRDKMTLRHPEVVNLFPCGEGAGYAGGILSAAMDGQKVAEAIKN